MRIDSAQVPETGGLKVRTKPGAALDLLKQGDSIDARVLSTGDNGTVTLKTADGQIVRARLEQGVSLKAGDEVTLEVTSKEDGYIALSASAKEPEGRAATNENMSAARGFEDKSLEPFAQKLMELKMPVREDYARAMRELMSANTGMTADEAAFIASNGISGDKTLMEAALALLSGGAKTDELVGMMLKLLDGAGVAAVVPDSAPTTGTAVLTDASASVQVSGDSQGSLTNWITNIAESSVADAAAVGQELQNPNAAVLEARNTVIIAHNDTIMQNENLTYNDINSQNWPDNNEITMPVSTNPAENSAEVQITQTTEGYKAVQEHQDISQSKIPADAQAVQEPQTDAKPATVQGAPSGVTVPERQAAPATPDAASYEALTATADGKPAAQTETAAASATQAAQDTNDVRITRETSAVFAAPEMNETREMQTSPAAHSTQEVSAGTEENAVKAQVGHTAQNVNNAQTPEAANEPQTAVNAQIPQGNAAAAVQTGAGTIRAMAAPVLQEVQSAQGAQAAQEEQPAKGIADNDQISKTIASILAEMPEFKGTPERALVRFSNMLLGAARDGSEVSGDTAEKLSAMLEKMFYRLEKDDDKAGERLKQAKDELFMRLSLVEEAVSGAGRHPARAELLTQTRKLMDHVRLINNIEQFVYMQIPVKMGEDRKTADLYLYKQKRGSKRIDPENVNILLSLDLDNVGHWESLVNIKGKEVSLRMEVSGEKVKEFFGENTVKLHGLLAEAGFKLGGTNISCSSGETTPLTALAALDRYKTGRAGAVDFTI